MCLFKGFRKLSIADHDIECYKILRPDLTSMYYNFQYDLDKLYSKVWDKNFIKHCNNTDSLGGNLFHSNIFIEMIIWLYGEETTPGKEKQTTDVKLSSNQVLVRCIIPKGSKYYKGRMGEIGSEQIIIKEIVNEAKQICFTIPR